jgi:hypothetical protein
MTSILDQLREIVPIIPTERELSIKTECIIKLNELYVSRR